MGKSRAERETIIRLSEDLEDRMTVFTHKERLAKRLLGAGGSLKRDSRIDGEVESWTVECPRDWFREPRPRRIRQFSEQQRVEMGQRLSKARKVLGALLITWLIGQGWAFAGESKGVKALIGPSLYYSALVGGDWYTTNQALKRGAGELNPAIQTMGMGNAKLLGGVALITADHLLAKHKKSQWALRVGSGIGYGYLMVRASRVK